MKKKTAVIILAFLAVCLCSCSKSKNDSGIDSEYVKTESVVTEESTEETTEVRGADMCPLYMYIMRVICISLRSILKTD